MVNYKKYIDILWSQPLWLPENSGIFCRSDFPVAIFQLYNPHGHLHHFLSLGGVSEICLINKIMHTTVRAIIPISFKISMSSSKVLVK